MKSNTATLPWFGFAVVALGPLLVSLIFPVSALAAPPKSSIRVATKSAYVCSMHPEVVTVKPGKCPKCKMPLVKKSVTALYTCSMHPEVLALKAGNCPKCGMTLTKKK